MEDQHNAPVGLVWKRLWMSPGYPGVTKLRRNWLSVERLEQSNEKYQRAGKESTATPLKQARQRFWNCAYKDSLWHSRMPAGAWRMWHVSNLGCFQNKDTDYPEITLTWNKRTGIGKFWNTWNFPDTRTGEGKWSSGRSKTALRERGNMHLCKCGAPKTQLRHR